MLTAKIIQKLVFIVTGALIFYSQAMLWQNYFAERTGKRLELNFMDPEYHLQRASGHVIEEELRKAIKLDPSNAHIHVRLADYYLANSGGTTPVLALNEYRNALLFSSKEQHAEILEKAYAKISQDYLILKKIVPDTDTARHSFAAFLRDKKLYEEASTEYKRLTENTSNRYILADSYNWTAIIYMWQNNFSEAIKYFYKAADTTENNEYRSWIFCNLGNIYLSTFEYKKAESAFRAAIKNYNKMAAGYYGLGSVYENTGDRAKARSYYQKTLKYRPDDYIKSQAKKKIEELR